MRVVLGILLLFLISCKHRDDTWDIVAISTPPGLKTSFAYANNVTGLLRQTHEPLFRHGENNAISSEILESWSRSPDSRVFNFCTKKGLEFEKGQPFNVAHLQDSLKKLSGSVELLTMRAFDNCVEIHLKRPATRLFDKLTNLEYAPTIPKNEIWEMGLGQFFVRSIDGSEIVLDRKVKTRDGFNRIRMISMSQMPKTDQETIEDFNLIPIDKIPAWVKNKYNDYPLPLLKSYGLLLNISDRKKRSVIYNCIDIEHFSEIFYGKNEKPQFLGSVLPIGIKGAVSGKVQQRCSPYSKNRSQLQTELIFANWKHSAQNELETLFSELSKRTGLKIKVSQIDPKDLTDAMFSKRKIFDIAPIAVDTENEEYLPFFEPFFDPNKQLHTLDLSKFKYDYQRLAQSESQQSTIEQVNNLNRILADEAIYVPLIQGFRTFYFPKDIVNMSAGGDFLGSFEIGKLKR